MYSPNSGHRSRGHRSGWSNSQRLTIRPSWHLGLAPVRRGLHIECAGCIGPWCVFIINIKYCPINNIQIKLTCLILPWCEEPKRPPARWKKQPETSLCGWISVNTLFVVLVAILNVFIPSRESYSILKASRPFSYNKRGTSIWRSIVINKCCRRFQ